MLVPHEPDPRKLQQEGYARDGRSRRPLAELSTQAGSHSAARSLLASSIYTKTQIANPLFAFQPSSSRAAHATHESRFPMHPVWTLTVSLSTH